MRLKWILVLVYLEIVLILTQDRCTVCVERTIGSEIILDTPDGTPCASKMISKPMVHLLQIVHLSFTDTTTVSRRTEIRFHMTQVTEEFYRVCR
jgi:hypothetical protein